MVRLIGNFGAKQITDVDMGAWKGEPFTGQGKWCFIRTNKPNGVRYRNVSVVDLR